jgi:hypothetical protein
MSGRLVHENTPIVYSPSAGETFHRAFNHAQRLARECGGIVQLHFGGVQVIITHETTLQDARADRYAAAESIGQGDLVPRREDKKTWTQYVAERDGLTVRR